MSRRRLALAAAPSMPSASSEVIRIQSASDFSASSKPPPCGAATSVPRPPSAPIVMAMPVSMGASPSLVSVSSPVP